jgi:hypothetical protein
VAHALAAQGCEASEDDIMVMNIVPPCIQSLVADNRTTNE